MERNAGAALQNTIDVLLDHRGRQTEIGNAPQRHAAGFCLRLVKIDAVAGESNVLRRRQSSRPRADDGDAFGLVGLDGRQFERRTEIVQHPAF